MTLETDSMNPHDDDEHTGSAKRNTVNGVAGLDTIGQIIIPNNIICSGSKLFISRDGSANIYLVEKLSDQNALRLTYVGSNDYRIDIMEGSAWKTLISAGNKNIVNGFSELVAAPAAANSTGTAGQIAYDAAFFYVCIATDTWERTALASW